MIMIKTIASTPGSPPQNIQMTDDEAAAFIAGQTAAATVQAAALLIQQAQAMLDKSDMVALRCLKAGVAFPSDWQDFVTACRDIVNGGSDPVPSTPTYPDGT